MLVIQKKRLRLYDALISQQLIGTVYKFLFHDEIIKRYYCEVTFTGFEQIHSLIKEVIRFRFPKYTEKDHLIHTRKYMIEVKHYYISNRHLFYGDYS